MYIETEYRQVELDDRRVFFLPPDCNHIFKADEINEFLTLDINKNILNKNDMYNFLGGKELEFNEKWKAVRYLLLNESREKNNSNAINNLFNYFYDLISHQTMNKSVEYINEHFYENIDLKSLAEMEHYNPVYYSEWFKRNMGITVSEYIKNLRIDKAKKLLADTDLSVFEIAQSVGYEHNSSFTRAFKEYENISPAQFRKRI